MGTGYATHMKVLGEWWFGPVGLMACETNPRSGAPNVCLAAEKSGEVWISTPPGDVTDWEPFPHQETCFVLFLLGGKGVVLFEAVCGTLEKLGQKTAQVLGVLEPLSDEVKQEPTDVDRIQQMAKELAFQAAKRVRRGGTMEPLFDLGRVVVSEGARNALTGLEVAMLLARHRWGDWGDVNKHDWKVNEDSVCEGARLLSVYEVKGTRFWALTEADRSVTTVLLPMEHSISSTDEKHGAARSAIQTRRGYAELVRK